MVLNCGDLANIITKNFPMMIQQVPVESVFFDMQWTLAAGEAAVTFLPGVISLGHTRAIPHILFLFGGNVDLDDSG